VVQQGWVQLLAAAQVVWMVEWQGLAAVASQLQLLSLGLDGEPQELPTQADVGFEEF
jgi:hypothetical protein